MKKIALIGCLAMLATGSWATNYYVSPTGSGSAYSESSPGKLTATVINKLNAGDVLYLMGGQYDLQSNLTINRNGTADNMITICPYNNERPIIDFRNQINGTNGITVKGTYLHIKGITIRYAGYKGIWLEGATYCILEQMEIYGCCNAGFQLRSGEIMVVMPTALPTSKVKPALVMCISVAVHGTTQMTAGTPSNVLPMVHRRYISIVLPIIMDQSFTICQSILVCWVRTLI